MLAKLDMEEVFSRFFSAESLQEEFYRRHVNSTTRGVDRKNSSQFEVFLASELSVASRKCLSGTYRFTPYLEQLKLKGRDSIPRMVSIPSVRDRVVISQLNKALRSAFPDESRSPLATFYIRDLISDVSVFDLENSWVAGCDIKNFYGSINRSRLGKILKVRLGSGPMLTLLLSAIWTPTVPKEYQRSDLTKFASSCGVPQGLAISNALAAIYMAEIDEPMRKLGVSYYRFVDDVLLLGEKEKVIKARKSFVSRARLRGLSVHPEKSSKSHFGKISDPFLYLGYKFQLPKVTVRESTVARLVNSLAAKISDFRNNWDSVLKKRAYLTKDMLLEVFLDELNERVSGAVSEGRRYGWIAYFSEINEQEVLFRLDSILIEMIQRDDWLRRLLPSLKKFSRSYYEMRHRPYGGYVRNYDLFQTPAQKLRFLVRMGQVSSDLSLSESEIDLKYKAYRDSRLAQMLADEQVRY
jgi:retron-type reverse transcriptase